MRQKNTLALINRTIIYSLVYALRVLLIVRNKTQISLYLYGALAKMDAVETKVKKDFRHLLRSKYIMENFSA